MTNFDSLPYELLIQLLLYSSNEQLVTVNRWTYFCLQGATTPRLYYKFLRKKGDWRMRQVVEQCLRYRFLSLPVLDQIEQNKHELITKKKTDRVKDIKLPMRLFWYEADQGAVEYHCGTKRKRQQPECGENKMNQMRFSLVHRLLDMGVSVKGDRGSMALLLSSKMGNLAMVRLLLRRGTNPLGSNAENKPLLMAVVYGHLDIVKRLMKAGAPATSLALRYAVQKKHLKIISWLMRKGAVPDMATIKLLNHL